MNRHTARALVKDAFYQVLDNKVFRILVLLTIVLVAPAFLVAFEPEKISVLFGWKTFTYADMGWVARAGHGARSNLNVVAIQALQSVFVQSFAGSFGISLCLAATAFFVPRMLEKGEADTLFSKPTGRFVLLFARYVSGVLFVGVLALVLVLGIHIGLLLRSGYSDPGFIWSALTLVYVFALVHAFSTMVGVVTRSAMTAVLLSIVLFGFNGCVQQLWVMKEFNREAEAAKTAALDDEGVVQAGDSGVESSAARIAYRVLDCLHYPLPKTSDADVLTRKLRTVVAGTEVELEDPAGKLSVLEPPDGFARAESQRQADLARDPAVWIARENGREAARITLSRRSRTVERQIGDKTRVARTSPNSAANDLVKALESRAEVQGKPQKARDASNGLVRDAVRWTERREGRAVELERAFLPIDEWMYEIQLECDSGWRATDAHERTFPEFLENMKPQRDSAADFGSDGLQDWYDKRFGWTAPLRFNAFFSLATSIAFALLMLAIARWRLARIDF